MALNDSSASLDVTKTGKADETETVICMTVSMRDDDAFIRQICYPNSLLFIYCFFASGS